MRSERAVRNHSGRRVDRADCLVGPSQILSNLSITDRIDRINKIGTDKNQLMVLPVNPFIRLMFLLQSCSSCQSCLTYTLSSYGPPQILCASERVYIQPG